MNSSPAQKTVLRPLLSLAVLATALVVGCGGSEKAEPAPGPKYPSKAAFCAALPDQVCSKALTDACGTITPEGCKQAVAARCTDLDIFFGVTEGGFNPDAAEDCLHAVGASFADGKIDATEYKNVGSACGKMFSAHRPAGAACSGDIDCGDGLNCVYDTTAQAAQCTAPGKAGGGESCKTEACQAGFFCEPTAAICFKGRNEGEPCKANDDPCQATLVCNVGKCVKRFAAGTECTQNAQCDSGLCGDVSDGKVESRKCLNALVFGTDAPVCAQFKP